MRGVLTIAAAVFALSVWQPREASAELLRGVVEDQTGLPLPGATVELMSGQTVVIMVVTAPDGTFEIAGAERGTTIVVKLDGFETITIPRLDAVRVILPIARASETTDVVAPLLQADSPSTPLLGSSLTATEIARMPSAHLQARESLPLLPSVIRGPDGLLRLGGARPSDSPLVLDGFDVTDPATGMSSISLPFEAVQGIEALRDPTSVVYGNLMGGLVKLESRGGGDTLQMGLQGFVPRPRFQNPGFGRIEGIFPRFYIGGRSGTSQTRYFGAVEYDFERIPVPDVTQGSGPNIVEQSASVFGRVDVVASSKTTLVIEGLAYPSGTDQAGLNLRRDSLASPNLRGQDLFGGVTSRTTFGSSTLLTMRVGVLSHDSRLIPNGVGPARLSPAGWRGNWFSRLARDAVRYSLSSTLERTIRSRRGVHDVTVFGSLHAQRMSGSVSMTPVVVENDGGTVVRTVDFDRPTSLSAHDWPYGVAVRDVWKASNRLTLDGGVRVDGRHTASPSARGGVRYELDKGGLTVLKASGGNFVGNLPLGIAAFASYPVRRDSRLLAGGQEETLVMSPQVDRLRLPHAVAATVQLERQLRPGLDAQVSYTGRQSTRVATLYVPETSGPLAVRSTGTGSYREIQASIRQTWRDQQQVFVSYVRSSSRGELNDFVGLFAGLGAPLVQPGGMSSLAADAPNRWIAWGTVNAPGKVVFSPVMEWHSGFPYSVVDSRYLYVGVPNGGRYPAFMAIDLIAYKTFSYRERTADLGIQLFNLTNHFNPREVYPVIGAQNFGKFTNSVGPILRGFMMIKW
jgi:hypothetical protein